MISRWLYFFLGVGLLYFAKIVFIPIFLSVFSAMLIEPFVAYTSKRNASRQIASIVVIAIFAAIAALFLWLIYLSFFTLFTESSGLKENLGILSEWISGFANKFNGPMHFHFFSRESTDAVQKVQIVEQYPSWTNYLINGVGSLSEIFTMIFFVPLLMFYFLYDKENLLESFNVLVGPYCYQPKLNLELPKMIRAFVAANFLTFLILCVFHGLALYFLNFNNWISLTLITSIISLLPIVGMPLAVLLPLTQGLSQGSPTFSFIVLAIVFASCHLAASNVILPQLTSSRINVNASALIVGLLFWGWLWGGLGFILAVPMTALLKIFLESNPETIPLANLLSARPRHVLPLRTKTSMKL